MKVSYLQRLETVIFYQDAELLREILSSAMVLGARFFQEGRLVAQAKGRWAGDDTEEALETWLRVSGVEVESVFDVEVLVAPLAGLLTPGLFVTTRRGGVGRAIGNGRLGQALNLQAWVGGGGTVFLVLNGPSLDAETRALLAHRPGVVTFGVNNGAHGFRPDLWACVDGPERFMGSIWQDGRILKFVPAEFLDREWGVPGRTVADCPRVVGYRRNERFSAARFLTEGSINWGNHKRHGGGRSVMLAALRIAYELGFRRVVLVGCDFRMTAEQRYWFAEQRTPQAIRNNQTIYRKLEDYFTALLPVFRAAGFAVVNATPGSALTVFPQVDLKAEVAAASVDVSGSTEGMYR